MSEQQGEYSVSPIPEHLIGWRHPCEPVVVARGELERLRRIESEATAAGMLTADGHIPRIGSTLFMWINDGIQEVQVTGGLRVEYCRSATEDPIVLLGYFATAAYSTREAAEAARKEADNAA